MPYRANTFIFKTFSSESPAATSPALLAAGRTVGSVCSLGWNTRFERVLLDTPADCNGNSSENMENDHLTEGTSAGRNGVQETVQVLNEPT